MMVGPIDHCVQTIPPVQLVLATTSLNQVLQLEQKLHRNQFPPLSPMGWCPVGKSTSLQVLFSLIELISSATSSLQDSICSAGLKVVGSSSSARNYSEVFLGA
jgi:hypothetical protein